MGKLTKAAALLPDELAASKAAVKLDKKNSSLRAKRRRKRALSPKEAIYVGERLKPGVGKVKAAHAAGLTHVPTRPIVEEAIQDGVRRQMKDYAITSGDVLLEIRRIAMVDPYYMYDDSNELLPIRDMDEDTRRAITSIEIKRTVITEPKSERETEITVNKVRYPKEKALEMLAKHFNILTGVGDETQRDKLQEMVNAIHAPFYAKQKEEAKKEKKKK